MPDLETIKLQSNFLRGGITETLADPEQEGFSEDDKNLIKFHGFYQQKNRDKDIPEQEKHATFLIRGRIPGGRLTAAQYLEWDKLSNRFGGGSLRLTTRQSLQLHGVVKDNLRPVMQAIHRINLTTQGACGDVVRNVTQAVNPRGLPELSLLDEPARLLSDHFLAKSSAWAEIWLGEERLAVPGDEAEPFYGKSYLPRKFKIAVTLSGDNGIDLLTNDLGLAATVKDGALEGYFVFAGGGMGMAHNKAETYPRLADLLGWIPAEKLVATAEAIVSAHRDLGDRLNRRHARLKYLVQEWGVERFRGEIELRQGFAFEDRELPDWTIPDLLGWQRRLDGSWALGVHVLCGRLRDDAKGRIKSALRKIVERFAPDVQLTADQDLILVGIADSDRQAIETILTESDFAWQAEHPLYQRAMACVSLPTCPLALAEAERFLPRLLSDLQARLEAHSLSERAPLLRLTGCPNGCARPYDAEIGVVGMASDKYAIFLGGSPTGERLARPWLQKIPGAKIAEVLDPVLAFWKVQGGPEESLGDFVQRVGIENLPKPE